MKNRVITLRKFLTGFLEPVKHEGNNIIFDTQVLTNFDVIEADKIVNILIENKIEDEELIEWVKQIKRRVPPEESTLRIPISWGI